MAYVFFWWFVCALMGCDALFVSDGTLGTELGSYAYQNGDYSLSGTTWIAKGDYTPSPFRQLYILKFGQPDDEGVLSGKGYDRGANETSALELQRLESGLCLVLEGKNLGVVGYDESLLTVTDELGVVVMEFERSL